VLPVFINMQRELPDRWSTRPGPFQLKTAAASSQFKSILLLEDVLSMDGRVLDGLDAGELHAAFYALEGLVQFGVSGKPEALHEATSCFEVLFGCIDDARSDVIAQGLGLGCTLRSLGFLRTNRWNDRLAELHLPA